MNKLYIFNKTLISNLSYNFIIITYSEFLTLTTNNKFLEFTSSKNWLQSHQTSLSYATCTKSEYVWHNMANISLNYRFERFVFMRQKRDPLQAHYTPQPCPFSVTLFIFSLKLMISCCFVIWFSTNLYCWCRNLEGACRSGA